jgi:hypothetical protein
MPSGEKPSSRANLIPIKPGEVRNPEGRKTAGAYIKEWINSFACQELSAEQLKKIARDPKAPVTKRAAAERMLRTVEAPDLADFEEVLQGESDLRTLRQKGVNTEAVKKVKTKTRTTEGKDGGATTEVEREIELYDRAGVDFDRVVEHTAGKPSQAVDVTSDGKPISAEATVDRIIALIAASAGNPAKPTA